MDQRDKIVLHLSLIDGVGSQTITYLTNYFTRSVDELTLLYSCSAKDFVNVYGVFPAIAEKLSIGLKNKSLLEKEMALCLKSNVMYYSAYNKAYFSLLKHVETKPAGLYLL